MSMGGQRAVCIIIQSYENCSVVAASAMYSFIITIIIIIPENRSYDIGAGRVCI